MSQLDGMRRYGESPKTPSTRTVEQLLRDEIPRTSPTRTSPTSTSPTFGKDHDQEEFHGHHQKKSVLTKVREKAKKLRHSLSGKKKQSNDENATPSWGVSLDDIDDDEYEGDPEYLGAPMYESELAPNGYKESARQHPRPVLATSEKRVLESSINHVVDQGKEKPAPSPNETVTEIVTKNDIDQGKEKPYSPNKTITETVTEKLAPAYATVSEVTQTLASKIQNLAISAPVTPPGSGGVQASSTPEQKWDKGVSVKEYLMNKLEPGEDEKALSQVISKAISPKKTPGDMGVVEKVKEAVTSLIWTENSAPSTNTAITSNSSPHIPISTNAHEVVEEENHGRILQAN